MAVDSNGSTAYLLTASGLSVVSLNTGAAAQNRVQVNQNGVVNLASYLPNIAPGSLVAIFGQNLASDGTGSAPLPKIPGGWIRRDVPA